MKTRLIILMLFGFLSIGFSQSTDSVQIEAMKKLHWIIGEWEGTAITKMGPQKADTVTMKETLAYDLNGTVVVIRGKGYMRDNDVLVHDAMAVISFDNYTGKYRWHSWRVPGGYYSEYEPTISEKGLSWQMKTPRGTMRYKLSLDENGDWRETGQFSADNENWNTFLEMHLKRISK